jgi:hypothetical protein
MRYFYRGIKYLKIWPLLEFSKSVPKLITQYAKNSQSGQPGPNPTIVCYNASVVKIHNASVVKIHNASVVKFTTPRVA